MVQFAFPFQSKGSKHNPKSYLIFNEQKSKEIFGFTLFIISNQVGRNTEQNTPTAFTKLWNTEIPYEIYKHGAMLSF